MLPRSHLLGLGVVAILVLGVEGVVEALLRLGLRVRRTTLLAPLLGVVESWSWSRGKWQAAGAISDFCSREGGPHTSPTPGTS